LFYCEDHNRDKPLAAWTEADWMQVELDYFEREGIEWREQQRLAPFFAEAFRV
jgi:hypothetical protein